MLLTQDQFQQKYDDGTLKICFIGMSNIGKSHGALLLQKDFGFRRYEVDGEIQKTIGVGGMTNASGWMGYPYEEKYAANEKSYLDLELEKTLLDLNTVDQNLVMDTTGSVIYLPEATHDWLRKNFLIISFDVAHTMMEDMLGEFFRSPKTVVWGNCFNQTANELGLDALRRCYPALLHDRIRRYRELADVTIPGEFSRLKGLQSERLLEILKLSLPKVL